MNDAVRRLRRRFDGCDSSLLPEVVRAFRELRPKMLRRLSLDIPRYRVGARSPARAQRQDYRIRRVAHGRRSKWRVQGTLRGVQLEDDAKQQKLGTTGTISRYDQSGRSRIGETMRRTMGGTTIR